MRLEDELAISDNFIYQLKMEIDKSDSVLIKDSLMICIILYNRDKLYNIQSNKHNIKTNINLINVDEFSIEDSCVCE